jgi:hypothetical protein
MKKVWDTNLEIGVPSSAPKDPSMDIGSRRDNQFIDELPYCIQHPLKKPTNSLSRPSKRSTTLNLSL